MGSRDSPEQGEPNGVGFDVVSLVVRHWSYILHSNHEGSKGGSRRSKMAGVVRISCWLVVNAV